MKQMKHFFMAAFIAFGASRFSMATLPYASGLYERLLRDDDTMSPISYPSVSIRASDQGHQSVGLFGPPGIPANRQPAPQWVLGFYSGYVSPDEPVTLHVSGLDADIFEPTTFQHAKNDATPILTFGLAGARLPINLDVTNFVNNLAVHHVATEDYIYPEFVIRPERNDSDSAVVLSAQITSQDGSKDYPFLPTGVGYGHFDDLPSGGYFDPPAASGFRYQTTDGSRFTRLFDLPSGFNSPFSVSVEGRVIGRFTAGESVEFSSFPGGGVSSFAIFDILPSVDPTNVLVFPVGLEFDHPRASFDMIPHVSLPGDFNDDGKVNAADYTVWRNYLGTNFDLNGNGDETDSSAGVVDRADYDLWKLHYGEHNPGTGTANLSSSVPEPSTTTMATVIVVLLSAMGRVHRGCRGSETN